MNTECCFVCNIHDGRQGTGNSFSVSSGAGLFIFRCPVDASHVKIWRLRVIFGRQIRRDAH